MTKMQAKSGKLIVLSAPSGTGKTVIKNALLNTDPTLLFSVSATTRKQREGERDGKDYYFITKEEFQAHIDHHEFIEYDHHFGNYYGTLRMAVEPDLKLGCNVIMDLDVNGALSVKKQYPENSVLIFIKPPSLDELKRRLLSRGTENDDSLSERLERASEEMAMADQFDHVVINDKVDRVAAEILDIIRS